MAPVGREGLGARPEHPSQVLGVVEGRVEVDVVRHLDGQGEGHVGERDQVAGDPVPVGGAGQQVEEPGSGRSPELPPPGHEGVERRSREHRVVEQATQVQHVGPDGDAHAGHSPTRGGEHAVGQVLDGEGRPAGDLEPAVVGHVRRSVAVRVSELALLPPPPVPAWPRN